MKEFMISMRVTSEPHATGDIIEKLRMIMSTTENPREMKNNLLPSKNLSLGWANICQIFWFTNGF